MALAFGSDQGERESRTRLGRITLLLFLLAVALLGLVVLRAYQARTTDATMTEVPVLRADVAPTRERPEDPGGMHVPNETSAVFQNLEGGADKPVVERLLPPPEEPLPKPVAIVVEEHTIPAVPEMPQSLAPPETMTSAEPAPPELTNVTPPEASAALLVPGEPTRPVKPPVEGATVPPLPVLADPKDGYRVQLGSFRDGAEATKGWQQAVSTAPKLLGPVSHFIFQADLGAGKGVFHRLQAGPFPSRESADSLCNQLKVKQVDCYVVSP